MLLLVPPPLQMIITGLLMWGVARLIPSLTMFFPWQRELALVLIGIGLFIEVMSMMSFSRAGTTVNPIDPTRATKLVVSGLYQFSRNPMYLGIAILLSGWALRLGSPLNILLLAGFIVMITMLQIKPEEKALREKFGDEYDDYCRRVRRWI